MTLEDFFTLTEMKDGLTAPARVEELVKVMQKERDPVVQNVCDATRQWSTVASTIAATDNRDCLDLFIQLGGLIFIGRWLSDAEKFGNDARDGFVEESIIALLRALEKLHIDSERSISSGIWLTVKNLVGHNSSTIQDSARSMLNNWKQSEKSVKVPLDGANVDGSFGAARAGSAQLPGGSGEQESSTMDGSPSKNSAAENHAFEAASDNTLLLRNSNDIQVETTEDLQIKKSNDQDCSPMSSAYVQLDGGASIPSDSPALLNASGDNYPVSKESPGHLADATISTKNSNNPDIKQDDLERSSKLVRPMDAADDIAQTCDVKFPELAPTNSASNKVDSEIVPLRDQPTDALDSTEEFKLQGRIDGKDGDCCTRTPSHSGVNVPIVESIRRANDCTSTPMVGSTDQGGECSSSILQESLANDQKSRGNKESDSLSSQMEDMEVVKIKEHNGGGGDLLKSSSLASDTNDSPLADMELDYGIADALEVARKVAKEIAREVVHYGDSYCSSSSGKISSGIRQPDSPNSINKQGSRFTEPPSVEAPSGENLSPKATPEGDHNINAENLKANPDNCVQDVDSSHVTGAAQEPEDIDGKGFCDFDLNQDVCSEDMDHAMMTPSTATVSVVSASRPAAAPGLPVAPIKFEGTLGWRGSAVTSAFRPASPRRTSDGDKPLSTEEGSSCSKQRQEFLDIDLNVGADNDISNLEVAKHSPLIQPLSSGDSSVEGSPRKFKGLNLDLNRTSDDGDAIASNMRGEGRLFFRQSGNQSPSPASSSSSMQPTVRNIDLNDPSFFSDSLDHRGFLAKSVSGTTNAYGTTKADDPAISLMGMRVELSKKEGAPQFLSPLRNGKVADPATNTSLGRMGSILGLGQPAPYAQPPSYGFNGLAAGPSVSLSPAMYGPGGSIPYMVDSRGAPVIPQLVTSAPGVSPSYSQPSFFMSLTGQPLGLNGAGPSSRPSFDLNSGFMTEVGARDSGGLRQLFSHTESKLMEEHVRANAQASLSLALGEKRKEPEGGWELYPFGNKLQQPPWR